MQNDLRELMLTVLADRLLAVCKETKSLDDLCRVPPPIPHPRFRSFVLGGGMRIEFAVGDYEIDIFLLGREYKRYIDRRFTRVAAEDILSKLGYRPVRVLRVVHALDAVVHWLQARQAGIVRAREHLLEQQADALRQIEAEYTLIKLQEVAG